MVLEYESTIVVFVHTTQKVNLVEPKVNQRVIVSVNTGISLSNCLTLSASDEQVVGMSLSKVDVKTPQRQE